MAPEDVYFWFLPSKLRMVFALGIIFVAAVVVAVGFVTWTSPGKRRDD
jgi:hypothetical protein